LDNARTIIDQLKMVADNSLGLYMIDKELAARTYVVPSPLAGAAE
jgi:ferritin